jgi:ribokinase
MSLHPNKRRYAAMVGVGGVGSGIFFALEGNHTLGREESRGGRLLDRRDYCKLHIVSHYVKRLLGPDFAVIPVGKVGDDQVGVTLLEEMRQAGLDLRYMERSAGERTLFAVCFIYPDGSGGNLTGNHSACASVDDSFVGRAEPEFVRLAGKGIALAMPEVPLPARRKLLEFGTTYGFLRAASFTSAEMRQIVQDDTLQLVDLLGINLDEAAAAVGISTEDKDPEVIVEAAVEALSSIDNRLQITITAGRRGSWSWDGRSLIHLPAFPANVASTAGAGDAHLAGIIAGLTAGLPLAGAHELGALTAALSITSPHTINPDVDRGSLREFASAIRAPLSDALRELLANTSRGAQHGQSRKTYA